MDSYPPHLLRLPGSAPGSRARGVLEGGQPATAPEPVQQSEGGHQDVPAPPVLVATPGTPGAYEPAVTPQGRPRNVAEMQARVTPATPEPWPEGSYVLMGQTGRRAHWTGTGWKGTVSPGYGDTVRSVTEQTEQP